VEIAEGDNMKYRALFLSTLLVATAASAAQPEPLVMESRMAIKAFAGELKGELQSAMKAGGPVNAIGVCNMRAPEIADSLNSKGALKISRVSLKNRNPGNAPDAWQKAVLEEFEKRKAGGEMADKIDYSETVETPQGKEFRYMKAIPTGDICLNCHGSSIHTDVKAKLDELYPDDKATGFNKGDIRGAFYVTIPQ
jgi:hypothetical protein